MKTVTPQFIRWPFAAILLFSAGLLSCGGGTSLISHETIGRNNKALYTTNAGYQLTLPDLYTMLEQSRILPKGGILSSERLQSFVDSVLVDTLLGLKAQQVELDKHFDYYRIYRLRYMDLLMRTFFDRQIGAAAEVDSQAVLEYYHAHPDQFTLPEQVLASTILINPYRLLNSKDSLVYRPLSAEARMQKAYEYAMEVRAKITSPELFPKVARMHSHAVDVDVTGGQLGWVTRGVFLDPFDSVTFSLQPGEISMPYRDRDGWHIMMVEKQVVAGLQPLEGEFYLQAARSVQMEQVNTLGGKLVDSIKSRMTVQYNDTLLDADLYATNPSEWIATINGLDTVLVDDIQDFEEGYRRRYGVRNTTADMKREMVEQAAIRPLVVRAARDFGYDTLPDVSRDHAFLLHLNQKHVLRQDFDPPQYEPTREDVSRYYREHLSEFTSEKPIVVQHIIAPDSAFGLFLRDQALSGVDFLELAKEYYPGDPSVRVELADIGAIGEAEVSPDFWHTATLTAVGDVSYPIKTADGYEVIKVVKRFDVRTEESSLIEIGMRLKEEFAKEYISQQRQKLYTEFGLRSTGKLPQIHLRPRDQRI